VPSVRNTAFIWQALSHIASKNATDKSALPVSGRREVSRLYNILLEIRNRFQVIFLKNRSAFCLGSCFFFIFTLASCLLILFLYLMKVYGITNCNTVKKALDWLKANHVDYEFHDFKKLGISEEKLQEWDAKAGYEKFLNKQGLTWKQLSPEVKESIITCADALKLLQQKTSMIKRPVIEDNGFLFFGFDEKVYEKQLIE
jgi:Spx/MgsR family transcriptional regulator